GRPPPPVTNLWTTGGRVDNRSNSQPLMLAGQRGSRSVLLRSYCPTGSLQHPPVGRPANTADVQARGYAYEGMAGWWAEPPSETAGPKPSAIRNRSVEL